MTLRILPLALILACLAAPGVLAAEPAADNRGNSRTASSSLKSRFAT